MSFGVAMYVLVIHLDGAAPSRFHLVPPCVPPPRSLRPCRFRLRVLIERFYDSSPRYSVPATLPCFFTAFLLVVFTSVWSTYCVHVIMRTRRITGRLVALHDAGKRDPRCLYLCGIFHCRWNTTVYWLSSHKSATRDAQKALGDRLYNPWLTASSIYPRRDGFPTEFLIMDLIIIYIWKSHNGELKKKSIFLHCFDKQV